MRGFILRESFMNMCFFIHMDEITSLAASASVETLYNHLLEGLLTSVGIKRRQ